MQVSVTTKEQSRCLGLLKAASEPMTAISLAMLLQLSGERETKRRHVRAIVKELRDGGSRIVATLQGGYWLTDDELLWRDYLDGRQIDAKRILAETHRRKKSSANNNQGVLFDTRERLGCAVAGVG